MKNIILLFIAVFVFSIPSFGQVSGFSGWNIFLDPGHSQNENVGAYGYSEAKKVLRVGLAAREILLNETDIDTVYLCRTSDDQLVGLSERCQRANTLGAAWYHSIHSDAPSTMENSTLLLWGQRADKSEKVPNGGKAMSSFIVDLLTRGYRTNTRGSYGDYTFYGGCDPCPYLAVNRLTTMPSELSEAGFHTNFIQNMINMNSLWKRLEARTLVWSFMKFKNVARPYVGIVAGHVKDYDESYFINGAVVSFDGKTDTTDTYENVFHEYSTDPNQLRNGFFYFENVTPGTHTLTVSVPGYDPFSQQVTVSDTFFTFTDPVVVSNIPPEVSSVSPEKNDSLYPGYDNLVVLFSRPMNKASVESNLTITPSVTGTFTWADNDKRLLISTENFAYSTEYTISISGAALDNFNHPLDGDGNGTGGDTFSSVFKTKMLDVLGPAVAQTFPSEGNNSVSIQPIVNLTFNEIVNSSTLANKFKLVRTSDQSAVNGTLKHYPVNGKSVLVFFSRVKLLPFTNYTVQLLPGIKDVIGNEQTSTLQFSFTTGDTLAGTVYPLDNFESGIGNWWQPAASSSTVGIIPSETVLAPYSIIYSAITTGTKSAQLSYAWDTTAADWLIREYYIGSTQTFYENSTLKVYLFGDGKNNKFRFCINDGGTGGHEVSPWYNVNWYGWREMNWTPSVDGLGSWIGDGILQGTLSFDSYQFAFNPGGKTRGEYYIDDAAIIVNPLVSVEQDDPSVPENFVLEQNFPNPFNPSTKIRFGLNKASQVKVEVFNLIGQRVAVLADGNYSAGYHSITFDASKLTTGIYIYKLTAPGFTSSKKLVLMK